MISSRYNKTLDYPLLKRLINIEKETCLVGFCKKFED